MKRDYPILRFERDADPRGEWIPLAVRMKLDLAGYKIGLTDWQNLAAQERQTLISMPAETDDDVRTFAGRLRAAIGESGGKDPSALPVVKQEAVRAWRESGPAPSIVAALLSRLDRSDDWARLDRFGRYVVYNLARKDDAQLLLRALEELLIGTDVRS